MVARDGRVRVLDFGLAEAVATAEQRFATSAGLAGTPPYMAPGQVAPGPVDARADQFGFCVALYEAVFGAHPFPAAS